MLETKYWRLAGPVSEAMYHLESDTCPRCGYCYMLVKGQADFEAMKQACLKLQIDYPVTRSRLTVVRHGPFKLLARQLLEQPRPLTIIDDFKDDLQGMTHFEALTSIFEPKYSKSIDLFNEAPAQFHMVCFPDNYYALVNFFHHIGSDAGNMTSMIRYMFAEYHRLAKGTSPDWATAEDMPSSQSRNTSNFSTWKVLGDMWRESRELKKYPLIRFGNEMVATSSKRHVPMITFNEEQTAYAIAKAKKMGLSFNDLVSICSTKAIDRILDTPNGTISLWIPVNVRSSTQGHVGKANHTTSININMDKSIRTDDQKLASFFLNRRTELLKMGKDVISLRLLEKLLKFAALFPLEKRRPVLRKIFTQPTTIMVSNVGIMWPERINGKLTGDSVLRQAGDLEILRYDMNFSSDEHVGHGLIAWTFRRRFNVAFSVYKQKMELETARRFLDHLERFLLA